MTPDPTSADPTSADPTSAAPPMRESRDSGATDALTADPSTETQEPCESGAADAAASAVAVQVVAGRGALGPWIERFDQMADDAVEPLRRNTCAVALFTAASRAGEFSAIWHAVNLLRGALSPRRRRQIPTLAVALAVESLLVNQGIKRLFKRARPFAAGDPRYGLRTPTTSSFPSGHASSAAFAATLLTAWDGHRLGRLWWLLAHVVAGSRLFVRVHHASDVIAGLAVGRLLGRLARRLLR